MLPSHHHEPAVPGPRHGGDLLELRCRGAQFHHPDGLLARLPLPLDQPDEQGLLAALLHHKRDPHPVGGHPHGLDPPVQVRCAHLQRIALALLEQEQPGVVPVTVGDPQAVLRVPARRRQPVLLGPALAAQHRLAQRTARDQRPHVQRPAVEADTGRGALVPRHRHRAQCRVTLAQRSRRRVGLGVAAARGDPYQPVLGVGEVQVVGAAHRAPEGRRIGHVLRERAQFPPFRLQLDLVHRGAEVLQREQQLCRHLLAPVGADARGLAVERNRQLVPVVGRQHADALGQRGTGREARPDHRSEPPRRPGQQGAHHLRRGFDPPADVDGVGDRGGRRIPGRLGVRSEVVLVDGHVIALEVRLPHHDALRQRVDPPLPLLVLRQVHGPAVRPRRRRVRLLRVDGGHLGAGEGVRDLAGLLPAAARALGLGARPVRQHGGGHLRPPGLRGLAGQVLARRLVVRIVAGERLEEALHDLRGRRVLAGRHGENPHLGVLAGRGLHTPQVPAVRHRGTSRQQQDATGGVHHDTGGHTPAAPLAVSAHEMPPLACRRPPARRPPARRPGPVHRFRCPCPHPAAPVHPDPVRPRSDRLPRRCRRSPPDRPPCRRRTRLLERPPHRCEPRLPHHPHPGPEPAASPPPGPRPVAGPCRGRAGARRARRCRAAPWGRPWAARWPPVEVSGPGRVRPHPARSRTVPARSPASGRPRRRTAGRRRRVRGCAASPSAPAVSANPAAARPRSWAASAGTASRRPARPTPAASRRAAARPPGRWTAPGPCHPWSVRAPGRPARSG